MTDVFYHVLTSSVRYQNTHAGQMKFICFIRCFNIGYPAQTEKCFENLRSDDLRAQNFAAHYIIRASVL